MSYNDTVTLGVTGASGSGYFLRLLQTMVNANVKVYLLLVTNRKDKGR